MTAALTVGILVAGGVYLMLRRELLKVTLGFVLLGHAVNVLFLAAGGLSRRDAPLLGENDAARAADPLPQAFVLTAIVITFGITVYLLALLRAEALRRRRTEAQPPDAGPTDRPDGQDGPGGPDGPDGPDGPGGRDGPDGPDGARRGAAA